MKFGTLQFFSWPGRRVTLDTVFKRALQRIQLMDESGFDAVWLAEHHFTDYSVCPSVHVMGMHVAERTEQIRIGTAVSLAAFYHPLRLAEEVALLDVLTDGRVNWGAGRGFDPTEFKTFGVPIEESRERFQEAVHIVHRAWTDERLNWAGKYWHFDDVEVLPKPAQQPHPPTWVAAGSDEAAAWAGDSGYTVMLGPHNAFKDIAARHDLFFDRLKANGHDPKGRVVPMTRFIAVAETDREAESIARAGAGWVVTTYKNKEKGTENAVETVVMPSGEVRELDPVERYLENVAVWGCPDRVVDTIQMLQETMYLEYLMLAPLSHSSFMMFLEKVLPRLR